MAPAGAFAAAHRQNDCACLHGEISVARVHHGDFPVVGDLQHHRVEHQFRTRLFQHVDETPGVFRAGQFFLEIVQAESVVDALVQDSARLSVAFHDENFSGSVFISFARGGQPGRTCADYDDIVFFHPFAPPTLVSPVSR